MGRFGSYLKQNYQSLFSDVKSLGKKAYEMTPAGVSRSNVDRTIAANKELAEYSYSKDLEMWERANEYNAPGAQMARLRAAGLNPNLVYGSGSAAGNTAGSLPKYQAPNVSYDYRAPINLGSIIGLYQDIQMKGAQIDNVRAQTAQTLRNTDWIGDRSLLTRTQQGHEATRAGTSFLQQQFMKQLQPYQFTVAQEGARGAALRNELSEAEKLFKMYRNQWMRAGVTTSDHPALRMLIRGWNSGALSEMMNRKWTDK